VGAPSARAGEDGDDPVASLEVGAGAAGEHLEETLVAADGRKLRLNTISAFNLYRTRYVRV
jgi:hypothetical protein